MREVMWEIAREVAREIARAWLSAKSTAPSTALSKNSSSWSHTEEKKMLGLLPPSSSVVGIRFSAAALRMRVPVAVEPVKPSLAMPVCVASASPASLP